jgi:hypothetical protein
MACKENDEFFGQNFLFLKKWKKSK